MNRWAWISGAGVLGFLAVFLWRETVHGRVRSGLEDELTSTRSMLADNRSALAESRERAAEVEQALKEASTDNVSLGDRISNLEAQRDHLSVQLETQTDATREAQRLHGEAQSEMQGLRRELLEQSRLPRELRVQLETTGERLSEVETMVDDLESVLAEWPDPLEWAGQSGDGRVFALSGPVRDVEQFPRPVLVCRRNTVLLEGFIHRLEGGLAIGHVANWRVPVSTLVNGEKVFILPDDEFAADLP